ncbi:MAG: hypothetical protein AAGF33_05350 [Pseudomonadota bacterium]
MSAGNPWTAIWRINGHFALMVVAGGIAWLAWQATSAEWYAWGILAVIMGLSAIGSMLRGLVETYRLAQGLRQLRRFKARGSDTRADRLGSPRDLKDRGMIR